MLAGWACHWNACAASLCIIAFVSLWLCGSQHRCIVCTNICFLNLLWSAMTADDSCFSSCCQLLPCKAQCAVRSTESHDCTLCVADENLILACCCSHNRVHEVQSCCVVGIVSKVGVSQDAWLDLDFYQKQSWTNASYGFAVECAHLHAAAQQ